MLFAPPDYPTHFRGREELRAQYGRLVERYRSVDISDLIIHETTNPDIIIAEYRSVIDLIDGGHYDNRYITVFTFRGGLVVHRRVYFNPLVFMELVAMTGGPVAANHD